MATAAAVRIPVVSLCAATTKFTSFPSSYNHVVLRLHFPQSSSKRRHSYRKFSISSSQSEPILGGGQVKFMMDKRPTKLDYYDDMWKLQSTATLLSHFKGDEGRHGLILDRTIFYPQGGGQPADTGFIHIDALDIKFVVHDVRSKDGIVLHYGVFEVLGGGEFQSTLEKGKQVSLFVDEPRRKLNSRLHSAGHLLDICLPRIGLGRLEPGKAYHFSDGPWVEYKGVIPQNEMQNNQKESEQEANALISVGGKVSADILPYDEAAKLCGGCLPDYVPKESTPRILRIGDNPGCPCGGTHVTDISDIIQIKVSQIRSKKGMTKVFYNVES